MFRVGFQGPNQGSRAKGQGSRVKGQELRVKGLGSKVWGLESRNFEYGSKISAQGIGSGFFGFRGCYRHNNTVLQFKTFPLYSCE